ncbi:GNAT family N-acetyltransferase [Pseudomonas phoenicis]|uniref:GNAT family N-acetyltransferase n=1 Tax=unclassified Pseudomonas TaxID=196821 RepID=UPI0039A10F89
MDEITVTPELSLVKATPAHASALYRLILRNKTSFAEHLHWPRYIHAQADVERFLAGCAADHQQDLSKTYVLQRQGEPCGVLSFNTIDKANETAYLGYWLDVDAQGSGLLSQAVNALVATYAERAILRRFVIKAAVRNERSNRLALRCGFQHEGVLRQAERIGDEYLDQNIYGLIV